MQLVNDTIVFSQEELSLLERLNPTMLDLARAFPEMLTISSDSKYPGDPEDAFMVSGRNDICVCPEDAFYIPGNSTHETYNCYWCACGACKVENSVFPCWMRRWNDVVATFEQKKFIVDGKEVANINNGKITYKD